jgi:hypothetical protein
MRRPGSGRLGTMWKEVERLTKLRQSFKSPTFLLTLDNSGSAAGTCPATSLKAGLPSILLDGFCCDGTVAPCDVVKVVRACAHFLRERDFLLSARAIPPSRSHPSLALPFLAFLAPTFLVTAKLHQIKAIFSASPPLQTQFDAYVGSRFPWKQPSRPPSDTYLRTTHHTCSHPSCKLLGCTLNAEGRCLHSNPGGIHEELALVEESLVSRGLRWFDWVYWHSALLTPLGHLMCENIYWFLLSKKKTRALWWRSVLDALARGGAQQAVAA